MRLLFFLLLFITLSVTGQTDTIGVMHKQQRFESDSGARYIVYWDEVVLTNKKTEKEINDVIKYYVGNYIKSAHGHDKATEYSPKCNVVYAKRGLISIFSSAYIYEQGATHGWREFNTLNYNAASGQLINFRDFIKPDRVTSIDSLLMLKLAERFSGFEFNTDYYLSQLKDLQFKVSDEGIEVLFTGETYATTIMDVFITYHELEPFVNKQGLLKAFYPSIPAGAPVNK